MVTSAVDRLETHNSISHVRGYIEDSIDSLLASLPAPEHLPPALGRRIIARYTAVLEGNFIYWMTGAYLAVNSDVSRSIILDNLHEEVRDSHPVMLRKFAVAANAIPTESDFIAVSPDLTNVRLFVGGLSGVKVVLMMTFFEGFIQRFMPFLADLADRLGSSEMEYTSVHNECDIAHTQGLFQVLGAELALAPSSSQDLYEGVKLLRSLIECIVDV